MDIVDRARSLQPSITKGPLYSVAWPDLTLAVENDSREMVVRVETGNPHDAVMFAIAPELLDRVIEQDEEITRLRKQLHRVAVHAKPSEYGEDEKWMLTEDQMRGNIEEFIDITREALWGA